VRQSGKKHRRHFSQHPPRIPGLRPSSGLRTALSPAAQIKQSPRSPDEIRGKSPWVAPRRKSPWAAIRHKHRRRFSQRPPRIPGLRPPSGLRTPRHTRPRSPDEATRALQEVPLGENPGEARSSIFLLPAPDYAQRKSPWGTACGLPPKVTSFGAPPGYEPRVMPPL